MAHQTLIKRDLPNKKLYVTREFNAPLEKVWDAWTKSDLLDKWWAPKPWKAVTKTMDFAEGGIWLYYMFGPTGEKHFSRGIFNNIVPKQTFSYDSKFCDEEGNTNDNMPGMYWHIEFIPTPTGSTVEVTLSFDSEAAAMKMIEMGFEGGFTMGLSNLDELLLEL
jgi:uncharacterized protein YndB with AHSA1/START domain